jgi:hypothetical protein
VTAGSPLTVAEPVPTFSDFSFSGFASEGVEEEEEGEEEEEEEEEEEGNRTSGRG